MSGRLDPLESDVASTLDTAKALDPLPHGAADRVLASLNARIATLPPDGGGESPVASPRPSLGWLRSRSAILSAVSFGLGVAVGAGARTPLRPLERIVYVDRPVPLAAPAEAARPPQTVPGDALQPVGSASRSTAAPGDGLRPPAAPASSRDQLAAESALLDLARIAVAQGDGDRALQAVDRHRVEFPSGLLAEEREALAIKALHLLGRDAEARARAARFERAYPQSLFLPALRGIVNGSL
jgi:hypothetical protein